MQAARLEFTPLEVTEQGVSLLAETHLGVLARGEHEALNFKLRLLLLNAAIQLGHFRLGCLELVEGLLLGALGILGAALDGLLLEMLACERRLRFVHLRLHVLQPALHLAQSLCTTTVTAMPSFASNDIRERAAFILRYEVATGLF